ncbi:MAG: IS30 family transposase [Polyangiaceae bacterium]|nr:IS30 family transposase [Polyangiaceae bacterium]
MSWRQTAAKFDLSKRSIARVVREAGGMPQPSSKRAERCLSLRDREEIRAGLERGESFAAISRTLGRPTSTVSREVNNNGGRDEYRAWAADRRATELSRRPKVCKLAVEGELREFVIAGLEQRWSPEQISAKLHDEFPDRPEMRVSHETIYQSLFIQARGQFRKDLTGYLRSGRSARQPQRREGDVGRPRGIAGMINISQRPAEADDRAVPGHWEGDLIMGAYNRSAIVTLVERSTRYVLLARIEGRHDAPATCAALTATISKLPVELRRSLTWDQGREMADHAEFTIATDVAVYFCDPHSPWQRGSNENTNGLLRQYFPKGTDLSKFAQDDLDAVARQLNGRPRQTLAWKTPAEKLNELIATAA